MYEYNEAKCTCTQCKVNANFQKILLKLKRFKILGDLTCLSFVALKGRLDQELKSVTKYRKFWSHLKKKDAHTEEEVRKK